MIDFNFSNMVLVVLQGVILCSSVLMLPDFVLDYVCGVIPQLLGFVIKLVAFFCEVAQYLRSYLSHLLV